MAKTKKKASKKIAKKKPVAKKAVKKAVKKRSAPKRAKSKPSRKASPRSSGSIVVTPELDARLRMLATNLGKTMDEILVQALQEFVETWEDHLQTVAALKETEDRVQLSVPKE
jgi:predicted DNA-binding protein